MSCILAISTTVQTVGPLLKDLFHGRACRVRLDPRLIGSYYESFIYAPLSINLIAPLRSVRPYLGLGPAFYFHFASTNQDAAFTDYLKSYYGSSGLNSRIGIGLTMRVGLDLLLSDSLDLGWVMWCARILQPLFLMIWVGWISIRKKGIYLCWGSSI